MMNYRNEPLIVSNASSVTMLLYPELPSVVICNRKSAIWNMGRLYARWLTWLTSALLPIKLALKLDVLFTNVWTLLWKRSNY